jgi:hypothetical protein
VVGDFRDYKLVGDYCEVKKMDSVHMK